MTGWKIRNTDLILTGEKKLGQFYIAYVHRSHLFSLRSSVFTSQVEKQKQTVKEE